MEFQKCCQRQVERSLYRKLWCRRRAKLILLDLFTRGETIENWGLVDVRVDRRAGSRSSADNNGMTWNGESEFERHFEFVLNHGLDFLVFFRQNLK